MSCGVNVSEKKITTVGGREKLLCYIALNTECLEQESIFVLEVMDDMLKWELKVIGPVKDVSIFIMKDPCTANRF